MMEQHRSNLSVPILVTSLFFNGCYLFNKFVFYWQVWILMFLGFLLFLIWALWGFWLLIRGQWRRATNYIFPLLIALMITAIPMGYIAKLEYMMRSKEFMADLATSSKTHEEYKKWELRGNWAGRLDFFVYSTTPLSLGFDTKIDSVNCLGETQQIDNNYYVFFCDPSYLGF